MSIVPPLVAGLCAMLVAIVMGYRLAFPHLSPPEAMRLAVADGKAMVATLALAAVLVTACVALDPRSDATPAPIATAAARAA